MLKIAFLLTILSISVPAVRAASQSDDGRSANRVAKLFYAARIAIGERTSFTDDPTSGLIEKKALLDSVSLIYERMADEKLNVSADSHLTNLWSAINFVIDKAIHGEFKGRWSEHPNFPGKLIPARFGKEVTNEFNNRSKAARIKWTTADEYLVNPNSKADEWEQMVIKEKFKSAKWPQGESFYEALQEGGKSVFRFAQPEYFKTSCMSCHGGEMGKLIHKGKGVAGSGTFGGLLSVRYFKD